MNRQFGVSTSICAGEIKKLTRVAGRPTQKQLLEGYLILLDDFAGFVLDNGFDTIEIEFGFSIISAELMLPLKEKLGAIIRPFRTVSCHLPLGEVNIAALHSTMRREAIAETERPAWDAWPLKIRPLCYNMAPCFHDPRIEGERP